MLNTFSRPSRRSRKSPPAPKKQIHSFKNLLKYANEKRTAGIFNDVTIKVGQQRFPANRLVLACFSCYFEKMFTTAMKERYEDTVQIKGVSESSMKTLIEYIYTRKIDINSENVSEIVAAADYLQIDDVKQRCFDFLSSAISIDNCVEVVKVADKLGSKSLNDLAVQFLNNNFSQVSQRQEFKDLSKAELNLCISKLNRNIVEEACLYKSLMRWIKQEDGRKESLLEFFLLLDLNKISSQFLEDVVLNETLIAENLQCANKVLKVLLKQLKTKTPSLPVSKILNIGGANTNKVFLLNNQHGPKNFPCLPQNELFRSVNFQGCIYCVGGNYIGRECCLKLDSNELTWENIASLNSCRPRVGIAVFRHKIVIAGGTYNEFSADCYDPSLNEWSSIPSLNHGRSGNELVVCNNVLYALGGENRGEGISSVEILNDLSDNWKVVQPMQISRSYFAAVNYRNSIYVIGGNNDFLSMKSVEKYDATSRKWEYVSNLHVGRRCHAACVVQDQIFVVGGLDEEGNAVREIECYDISANKWTIVWETKEELFEHSIVVV